MRRFGSLTLKLAQAAVVMALINAGTARADLTLFEKDGWSVRARGMIAAHYQLTLGDGDPMDLHGVRLGNRLPTSGAQDPSDNKVTLSRVRSGFIGTQLGFGVDRQINEALRVESMMAVSLNDVSSSRNEALPKAVDFREAWAALVSPIGTLKFGRMFHIFGSASAPVVVIAHRFGIGNPCVLLETSIACASVGAGPLYAGFDAQLRYISPRMGGLEVQVALSDPWVGGMMYRITKLPRFDGELNFEQVLGGGGKLKVIAQGVVEQLKNGPTMQTVTPWGVIGSGVLEMGVLTIGGGAWTGKGVGTHTFWETSDAAGALGYDAKGTLRQGRGFFGNAAVAFGASAVAAGGGAVFIQSTADDVSMGSSVSVISSSTEFHVVYTRKIDAVTLNLEYMRWMSKWYFGEKQNMNFIALGANYAW